MVKELICERCGRTFKRESEELNKIVVPRFYYDGTFCTSKKIIYLCDDCMTEVTQVLKEKMQWQEN